MSGYPCECCERRDVDVVIYETDDDDAVVLCDSCVQMLREARGEGADEA